MRAFLLDEGFAWVTLHRSACWTRQRFGCHMASVHVRKDEASTDDAIHAPAAVPKTSMIEMMVYEVWYRASPA